MHLPATGGGAVRGCIRSKGRSVRQGRLQSRLGDAGSVGWHVYNETALEWRHAFALGVLSAGGSFFTGNDGSHGNTQQISFADGVSWKEDRLAEQRDGAASGREQQRRPFGIAAGHIDAGGVHAAPTAGRDSGIPVGLEASGHVQQQADDHVHAIVRRPLARWTPARGVQRRHCKRIDHGSGVFSRMVPSDACFAAC